MTLAAFLSLVMLLGQKQSSPALVCPPSTEKRGEAPPVSFEVYCEGKDEHGRALREGPYRRYYDDGRLWVEASFKNGVRDGAYVEYFRNGKKAREGLYANGKEEGLFTLYFESGAKEEEAEYRSGAPDGLFVAYREDGTKKTEGRRCGGAQCGVWRTYDERGQLEGEVDFGVQSQTP